MLKAWMKVVDDSPTNTNHHQSRHALSHVSSHHHHQGVIIPTILMNSREIPLMPCAY